MLSVVTMANVNEKPQLKKPKMLLFRSVVWERYGFPVHYDDTGQSAGKDGNSNNVT